MTEREKLKVSARVMYDEFVKQGVPIRILSPETSLLEYTDRSGQNHLLFSTLSDKSSAVGLAIASSKQRTSILASQIGIPVPAEKVCDNYKEVLHFFKLHKNVVTKPLSNSGGTGVTVEIKNIQTLKKAYLYARRHDSRVIVQEYIQGTDLRMLIINGMFCSAVERRAAHVTGDGRSTVRDLMVSENKSSLREAGSMAAMDLIDTASADRFLGNKALTVPEKGLKIRVIGPANLSRGGTAHEATHLVSPGMIEDAEQISRKLGLGICGVDMIWNQMNDTYYLIEVNGTPGINMHNDDFWGTSSDAITRYVNWLVNE